MCSLDSITKSWLEERVIPILKTSLNKSKCTVSYEISVPTDSHFMARVFFLDLKFIFKQEKKEEQINLVVKRPPTGNSGHNLLNLDASFHNEILFYKKYAYRYQDYPQLYYVFEKPPYDSIIIVQNLNKIGYHLNSEKVNLEFRYTMAAVNEIAKFHVNSYVLKEKNPEEFFEIIQDIQSIYHPLTEDNLLVRMVSATIPRVIKYLRKENYDKHFCDKLAEFLPNGFHYVQCELRKPVEPLATLCHGDFIRNNVFFKESNDGIKAKLIDFGMINYGSPAMDLSHFLFLSGTRSHRTDKFQQIFDAYYETLINGLIEAGISNLEKFSKERFLDDYKSHAFHGYMIASIFFPVMMGYFGNDAKNMVNLPIEKVCEMYNEAGGDEFTKILVAMLLDLREAGCFDHIINT